MRECIYCRQPLSGEAPPEHVIPQGFGRFKQNLTLHCVCSDCNRFFGSTLEWPMRNASHEGVLRFHHDLGAGQVGSIGTKGIELTVAEAGDWAGSRVILKVDRRGKTYTEIIPQVGARRNSSEPWTWYLEKDLNAAFAKKYPKSSEFHIIGREDADRVRIEKRLLQLIPTYTRKEGTIHRIGADGKVLLHFEKEFDAAVRRCLAKIAFNYLAYIRGEEFVLGSQFDEARCFIRNGTEARDGIVFLNMKPILAQELLSGMKITDGHILTVEGRPTNTSTSKIEVRLSLFNSIRYRIVLSAAYSGLWFAFGNHFDIESREISELKVAVPIYTV